MDNVKEAFQKVRQDTDFLKREIYSLKRSLFETKEELIKVCEIIKQISMKAKEFNGEELLNNTTDRAKNQADFEFSSTPKVLFEALKGQKNPISIGNEGVSTDRQTDKQTDRQTESIKKKESSIDNAVEILDSLDNIKKEIRLKFKRLTNQEILIFSTIYQLDEEIGFSNYSALSEKLKLSESSVRDYVGRLIKKGIPIEKNKINNKNIQLSISKNLKKIASLPTILQLREI